MTIFRLRPPQLKKSRQGSESHYVGSEESQSDTGGGGTNFP
jgi:hypothetical protein